MGLFVLLLVGPLGYLLGCGSQKSPSTETTNPSGSSPTLQSIAVTPANPSIPQQGTQPFTATGTFSDNSTHNLTSQVTWSSSSSAVATINSAGLATGVGAGNTTIQASLSGVNGSTGLTVTAATLQSLAITPANPSIRQQGTQPFTATGTFSDNSTQNLTGQVTWSSSNTAVATINSAGLATGVGAGSTTIQASLNGVNASTTLSVTTVTLQSIAVTLGQSSIAQGMTTQATCTATYSDSSTTNCATSVLQSQSNLVAGTSAVTVNLTTAPGDDLILLCREGIDNTGTFTITDSASQNWTQIGTTNTSYGSQHEFGMWVMPNSAALSSVTCKTSSSNPGTAILDAIVYEVAGAATSSPLDAQVASANDGSGGFINTLASGPLTTTNALDILFFGVDVGSTETWTLNNDGFAIASNGSTSRSALAYKTVSTTQNGLMTALSWPTASNAGSILVALKASATSGPTWTSQTPAVASVSGSGLVTGSSSGSGSSVIQACIGSVCGTTTVTVTASSSSTLQSIAVTPANPSIVSGAVEQFTATGTYSNNTTQNITTSVTWSSSNASVASISNTSGSNGTATSVGPGSTTIQASLGSVNGSTSLTVTTAGSSGFSGVLTQHNDNGRTGQNLNETILTPVNVNVGTFGKVFSQPVDGYVYAQPLYVPNLSIAGAQHNVVFVATEGDSVYAFDADNRAGGNASPLWHASLIDTGHGATAGETTGNITADLDPTCTDVVPQIGVTSTPVIDPSTGTMYVEAISKQTNGNYLHRLHMLDITTGAEKSPGPVIITATVPGTSEGGTSITFNALFHLNRPGLLLVNGMVYLGYASHCDDTPYHGWIFAYNASSLARTAVFITTPNGNSNGQTQGGIWMSGGGLAADSAGNIFTSTGNGSYGATEVSDSILRLNGANLTLGDYFTPFDQGNDDAQDYDVASGGVVLLPDQPGAHPHELVTGTKGGAIYLLDRDQMTTGNQHYCSGCSSDPEIVQEFPNAGTAVWLYATPAYWNGTVYFWGTSDVLKAYTLSNGLLVGPKSSSTGGLGFPGVTPSISANGATNGIVWAIDSTEYGPPGPGPLPAVLHAYDATNVANELWNSSQAANNRDTAGNAVKFAVPTIGNGKVYVGTQTELDVYGLQ